MPAPKLRAYPKETVIAEKVQAMVFLGIANSRMKDFFDVWFLAMNFQFDGSVLSRAIKATFERRKTELPKAPPLALTKGFSEDDAKMKQWKAFVSKSGAPSEDSNARRGRPGNRALRPAAAGGGAGGAEVHLDLEAQRAIRMTQVVLIWCEYHSEYHFA